MPVSAAAPSPIQATAFPISTIVLTKNSAALLPRVLRALDWCDEVVVLDTGSIDATKVIATEFSNVSLHNLEDPFPGFGLARQAAVAVARHDWILSIDSDEIVSPALAAEIRSQALDPGSVYTIRVENYFNGEEITTCGWAPDRHERLFHRLSTNFCASAVHERVQVQNLKVVRLRAAVRHYSYRCVDDFLHKMRTYANLFSQQNAGRLRSSPTKAFMRSTWAFFKSYFLERGVMQGGEGLVISAYKAQTVFWKYLLLHEKNRRRHFAQDSDDRDRAADVFQDQAQGDQPSA